MSFNVKVLQPIIESLFGSIESFDFLQLRLILEAVSKQGFTVDRHFYFKQFMSVLGQLKPPVEFRAIEFTADETIRILDAYNEKHGKNASVYGGFCATIEAVIDTLAKTRGIQFRENPERDKFERNLERAIFHQNLGAVVKDHLNNYRAERIVVETTPEGKKRNVRRWAHVELVTTELPIDSGMFAPTETAYSTPAFLDRLEKEKD
jgi:hypothetical protein